MKTATIEVYGDIGFYDWDYDRTLDGAWMSNQLAQIGADVQKLEVRINTFGGVTAEGLTMYNRMKDFSRKRKILNPDFSIETHVDGYAYSAGSLLVLGGDKRIMHLGSQFMIHNAMAGEFGDYRAMQSASEWLKKTSESVASLYAAETGLKADDLQEMMDATTFFTADETVKAGFAHSVDTNKTTVKDTSLYKGVDPRPLNYSKYIGSTAYKTVAYERPKAEPATPPSPQSEARKAQAKTLMEMLTL